MAWERLAHTAWNNSTPDDMEIEFAKRQNIKVITYIVASGNVNAKWILNDSTGNPYTNKYGDNGANMSADTSDSAMDYDIGTVTGASYNVHTIHNVDGREKLYIGQQMTTSSGDGSGTVPKRREWAGKFTTTSGQINKIKVTSDGSGNMTACYWRNGQRVDLGSGELSDIVVSDGKVYSVGYDFGGSASYWMTK